MLALLDRTARDVKMSYQLLREKQLQYLQFHSLDLENQNYAFVICSPELSRDPSKPMPYKKNRPIEPGLTRLYLLSVSSVFFQINQTDYHRV